MTPSILARIPLSLAQEGFWDSPLEVVLVHYPKHLFNGAEVRDVISLVMADKGDIASLSANPGYDPGELMGNTVALRGSDLRALAVALAGAADRISPAE